MCNVMQHSKNDDHMSYLIMAARVFFKCVVYWLSCMYMYMYGDLVQFVSHRVSHECSVEVTPSEVIDALFMK